MRRQAAGAARPAALLLLLAACAGMPVRPPELHPGIELDLGPQAMPGAERLLAGFDEQQSGGEWRSGDRVLLGLQLTDGARQRRWLVRLTVDQVRLQRVQADGSVVPDRETWKVPVRGRGTAEFHSERMSVQVLVADEEGHPLGESLVKAPRELLEKGFAKACLAEEPVGRLWLPDPDRQAAARDRLPHTEAVLSLVALLGIVQQDPILAELLWEVVERPGFFSVLANLGVHVTLRARFDKAVRATAPPHHLPPTGPVWWVPLTLLVNDDPALFCELLVTSPSSPLGLCGGIVGIRARHPRREDLRFSMVLLAARRSSPSPTPSGAASDRFAAVDGGRAAVAGLLGR